MIKEAYLSAPMNDGIEEETVLLKTLLGMSNEAKVRINVVSVQWLLFSTQLSACLLASLMANFRAKTSDDRKNIAR